MTYFMISPKKGDVIKKVCYRLVKENKESQTTE